MKNTMNKLLTVFSMASLSIASTLATAGQSDCDAEAGKQQYNKCVACHSTEAGTHLMGPSLHGLMGTKVGTASGFTYSFAMEEAGFQWTDETLSYFLASPMQYVPGTTMPFGGIKKEEQRDALICFIKQLN